MAVISISYEDFLHLKDVEEKYNSMLKTWKPISEKSLQKEAEKKFKLLELTEKSLQKAVEKELKITEIKQCTALTKQKCQCKNHVTNNSDFCERHSTDSQVIQVTQIIQVTKIMNGVN